MNTPAAAPAGPASGRLPAGSLDHACFLLTRLGRGAVKTLATLATWRERARGRHHLAAMDARLRRDIGVGSEAVFRELRKPFWIP